MRKYLLSTTAIAGLFLAPTLAQADLISIGLQETGTNSGNITTEGTSVTGAASIGPISYGTFSVDQTSAQSQSALGPPGLLNTQTLDISTSTAGTLKVFVTAQNLTGAAGLAGFLSTFAVNALNGSVTSVTEATFLDTGNGLYTNAAANLLDTETFTAINTAVPETAFRNLPGTPFSATEVYTIVDAGGGAGNTNLTIDLSATSVPEPGTLGLLGTFLTALGGLLFWRRKNGGPSYA